jgi:hypothetical protein
MLDTAVSDPRRPEQRPGGVESTQTSVDPAERERAAYLLTALRGRGFTLWADGDARLVVSPASKLAAGEAGEIREYKPLLLVLLADEWTDDDRANVTAARVYRWWRPGLAEAMRWDRPAVRAATDRPRD